VRREVLTVGSEIVPQGGLLDQQGGKPHTGRVVGLEGLGHGHCASSRVNNIFDQQHMLKAPMGANQAGSPWHFFKG